MTTHVQVTFIIIIVSLMQNKHEIWIFDSNVAFATHFKLLTYFLSILLIFSTMFNTVIKK